VVIREVLRSGTGGAWLGPAELKPSTPNMQLREREESEH